MKKLILLGFAVLLITACQQQEKRYFAESAEINTIKAGIASYESGDWDTWRSHFADTAKIYINSDKSIAIDKRLEDMKGMTAAFSSYGFDHEDEHIEMVIDKLDETWVYYWSMHNGTIAANNKKLSIPVHLAIQFVDGKIVKEHVYYDGTEMNKEMEALAAAAEAEATN